MRKADGIEPPDEVASITELVGFEKAFRHMYPIALRGIAAASIQDIQPALKSTGFRKSIKEVEILLLDKEIGIIDCDRLVCSRPQAQRLDLDVSVIQIRGEIRIIRLNPERRRLGQNADAGKRNH